MEHAAQIHVDDAVKLLEAHLLQPRVLGDAGVVDQHVDAAKMLQHLGHQRINLGALRHVEHAPQPLGAQGLTLRQHLIDGALAQIADHHARTFDGELERGGGPDALGLECAMVKRNKGRKITHRPCTQLMHRPNRPNRTLPMVRRLRLQV